MNAFRRLVLRRTQAPKRSVRRPRTEDVTPVVNDLRVDIPCEVIDLSRTSIRGSSQGKSGRQPSWRRRP